MPSAEVVVKNRSWKKAKFFKDNIELLNDAIKEYAYKNYKGTFFSILFFGEIGKDFRAVALIGEAEDEDNWNNNKIFSTNKEDLDKNLNFGVHNLSNKLGRTCVCIKFNEKKILEEVLKYISEEKFNGGYYAKGRFFGKNADDLIFVGISGDYRDKSIRETEYQTILKK